MKTKLKKLEKRTLLLAAIVALVAAAAPSALGQTSTVSVQFVGDGTGLLPTDTTGASGYAASNYNDIVSIDGTGSANYGGGSTAVSGSGISLHDSTGASSGVTLSYFANGGNVNSTNSGYHVAGANAPGSTAAQNTLFSGGIDSNSAYNSYEINAPTFTLTGITAPTYNLIVYYIGDAQFGGGPSATTGTIMASGAPGVTYYVQGQPKVDTGNQDSNGNEIFTLNDTFTQTSATTATFAPNGGYGGYPEAVELADDQVGSYVVFSGLTAADETVTLGNLANIDYLGNPHGSGLSLVGFQIEPTVAAPEPQVWAMLLAGLGMLGLGHKLRWMGRKAS